jgi:hypothetical protein
MNEFDWNRLRVGDRVLVREHRAETYGQARAGTIAFVNRRPRHNDVGVRADDDVTQRVFWPTRFELGAATAPRPGPDGDRPITIGE